MHYCHAQIYVAMGFAILLMIGPVESTVGNKGTRKPGSD